MTSMSLRPLMGLPTETSPQERKARAAVSPWVWMAVTCLLLAVSGGVRFWREWKFSALAVEGTNCPFALSELPNALGTWQAVESSETKLDPEIARIAGASDHAVRSYLDRKTGEESQALILYGLGTLVYGHVPDFCYPAAGYKLYKGPFDRTVVVPGVKNPVTYRWAIYTKRVGSIYRYVEVYYTFLHRGDWLPDMAPRWKQFRYYPGLFKVQIEHPVIALDRDGQGPGLGLLSEMTRVITNRLSSGEFGENPKSPTAPAPAPASTPAGG